MAKITSKETPKQLQKSNSLLGEYSFLKSLLALSILAVLFLALFRQIDGYNWVWEVLVKENLGFIGKYRNLDNDNKLLSKFGADYAALKYLRDHTPDNAVILIPPRHILLDSLSAYNFMRGHGGIKHRNWSLYFVYPRKLVYFEEQDKSPFTAQITHVMVLNGWGKDLVADSTVNDVLDVAPITPQYPNRF